MSVYIESILKWGRKKKKYNYNIMSFNLRKLTPIDLLKLEKIYIYLENHPNCLKSLFENTRKANNHHAKKIAALDQRGARGSTAGIVKYHGQEVISKLSLEHPILDTLLIDFMKVHNKDFIFNSVYITKNCQSKPHRDSGNIDKSIIVSIGKFTGGNLYVKINNEITKLFDIRNYSLEFDGATYTHYTEPFVGNRYSLIYY